MPLPELLARTFFPFVASTLFQRGGRFYLVTLFRLV